MERAPVDGCLVPAEPFIEAVQAFVRQWNRERPQPGGQFGVEASTVVPIRALQALAAVAELSEATIRSIYEGRFNRIELRVADGLVVALERPDLFYDERVDGKIEANPFASAEARTECCGGATEGAAAAGS
jgi:hypothetical protein